MKSKDDGSRGPCGPDGSVTPRYITKKSPRNVRHGVLETSLTISRVFSKIEFLDYTGVSETDHRSPRPGDQNAWQLEISDSVAGSAMEGLHVSRGCCQGELVKRLS